MVERTFHFITEYSSGSGDIIRTSFRRVDSGLTRIDVEDLVI